MTVNRDELARAAMIHTERYAQRYFAGHWDRETLVADAVSRAWEFARTAGETATPLTIAKFAVRRVSSGRRFAGSTRSIDHPRHREQHQPVCLDYEPTDFTRPGDDPALIAALRIDMAAWFASLSPRNRAVARLLAVGTQTREVASLLGISPARVSQLRRELSDSWREFIED